MNYWNDIYWKKNLDKNKLENLDFLKDIWWQYTKYFKEKGFEVISCDISNIALETLKNNIPDARTKKLDMA